MKKTPSNKTSSRRRFKSSMSVSQQVVCEDDACIGKNAGQPAASPARNASAASNSKSSTSGSMTVAGQPACEDEACIGKQ